LSKKSSMAPPKFVRFGVFGPSNHLDERAKRLIRAICAVLGYDATKIENLINSIIDFFEGSILIAFQESDALEEMLLHSKGFKLPEWEGKSANISVENLGAVTISWHMQDKGWYDVFQKFGEPGEDLIHNYETNARNALKQEPSVLAKVRAHGGGVREQRVFPDTKEVRGRLDRVLQVYIKKLARAVDAKIAEVHTEIFDAQREIELLRTSSLEDLLTRKNEMIKEKSMQLVQLVDLLKEIDTKDVLEAEKELKKTLNQK